MNATFSFLFFASSKLNYLAIEPWAPGPWGQTCSNCEAETPWDTEAVYDAETGRIAEAGRISEVGRDSEVDRSVEPERDAEVERKSMREPEAEFGYAGRLSTGQ